MQENTITLSVDHDNDGSNPVNQVLSRHEETVNRTTYVFDATHTMSARDQVQLYRTFPKRSGSSRGSSKCAVKFTADVSVDNAAGDGAIVLPLIGEVTFSVPVGATAADMLLLRQRIISFLDRDDVAGPLMSTLEI